MLSGRAKARIGLPKLRAEGELLELGPAALALSDAEAHALLDAAGAELTKSQAEALNERAEGWAAGLYLAPFRWTAVPRQSHRSAATAAS